MASNHLSLFSTDATNPASIADDPIGALTVTTAGAGNVSVANRRLWLLGDGNYSSAVIATDTITNAPSQGWKLGNIVVNGTSAQVAQFDWTNAAFTQSLGIEVYGDVVKPRRNGGVINIPYTPLPVFSLWGVQAGDFYFLGCDDTVLYVSAFNEASVKLQGESYDLQLNAHCLEVATFNSQWASDDGIATDTLAGVTLNDTFVHRANFLMFFEVTTAPAGGEEIRLRFRVQDSVNFWELVLAGTNSAITLNEVVSNVSTQRGTANAAYTTGSKVLVVCDDDDIYVLSENTLLFTYASASRFKTKTSGLVAVFDGGAIDNLYIYPRKIEGERKTEIRRLGMNYNRTGYATIVTTGGAMIGASKLLSLLNGVPIVRYLYDLFASDDAAPIASPRNAEPGPGSITYVQTDGEYSVSAGKLVNTVNAISDGTYRLSFGTAGFSRVNGVAVKMRTRYTTLPTTGNTYLMALSALSSLGTFLNGFYLYPNTGNLGVWASPGLIALPALTINTDVDLAIVLRSTGAYFIRDGVLVWVSVTYNNSPMYMYQGITGNAVLATDSLAIGQLQGSWATDDWYSVGVSGAVSNGYTFIHPADFLLYTTITVPSSGDNDVWFRSQDGNNYWLFRVDSGGTAYLYEVVSGSATLRGSAAGVVTGQRIGIIASGTTISAYRDTTLLFTYASASNFQTETDGFVSLGTGGGFSDLYVWMRNLTSGLLEGVNAL